MAHIGRSVTWSDGEHRMHELLHVPENDNPTAPFLTAQASYALSNFPLIAVGISDRSGRPWTTIWGGSTDYAHVIGPSEIGISTMVTTMDPVANELKEQGFDGQMLSALSIDLVKRKRVKLFGRVVAGVQDDAELRMVARIEQSMGNCPKYLNQKTIHAAIPAPRLLSNTRELDPTAVDLLRKADLFFMTTCNPGVDMDTNHRGGNPGFVNVESSTTIIYPEYSGNRLYQSLGNLLISPLIGMCIPDFETGDVLYITGSAKVLIGEDAGRRLPHTNLAVEVAIDQVRYVAEGLSIRGDAGEQSPYNPRIKSSKSEPTHLKDDLITLATLVARQDITGTISKYRFRTERPFHYKPGQWVVIDLSKELDIGYSHMRDDDPQSLNDDFIRTFTISSQPISSEQNEFEITMRTNGPVTSYLRQQHQRSGLEIEVLGVGGDFEIEPGNTEIAFIAGGVGITPLLGQLGALDISLLRLIWIVKADDINFALSIFDEQPLLVARTTLFLTSSSTINEQAVARIEESGARYYTRRPTQDDVRNIDIQKWYICASLGLRKQLMAWLGDCTVLFEDFDY